LEAAAASRRGKSTPVPDGWGTEEGTSDF